METDVRMTSEQAEKEVEQFKKIFDIVRILSAEDLHVREKSRTVQRSFREIEADEADFCGRERACENCISAAAFREKTQKVKMEYWGSTLYEVTGRYVEIDEEPCVMELIRKLSQDAFVNVKEQKKLFEKLTGYREELYMDALTGAYNRRYYEEKLKKKVLSAGVAMIDVDDFKLYNDTFGHEAGDAVLVTLVDIIKHLVRRTDSLVRYGGDEFLLLMPDVTETIFLKKLKKIQQNIQNADIDGYEGIRLSVSIGGVITKGQKIGEVAAKADKFMYRAKNQKNVVVTEWSTKEDTCDKEKIKPQILIVDDSALNRMILSEILKEDYRILEAESGEECLKMLDGQGLGISMVLLDIVMPGMDGFEVLGQMNRNHWIEEIPVIMISSEDSESYIRRAYEMGVSDYISRPFDAKIVYQRVFNTIKLYSKQRRLISLVTNQIKEKEKSSRVMVGILSQIVEFRNGESGLHVQHINILTRLLLARLVQKTGQYSLSWTDQHIITMASALHDIGKIGIDEKILNKPGALTAEEFEIMKSHTVIGASILKSLELYQEEPLVKVATEICRWHHERYDGKGYPDGLRGEEIPISAQVVSMADVYDALISERVYKKEYSHEKAMQMILAGECGAFNPLLLECLQDIQQEISDGLPMDEEEGIESKQREYGIIIPKFSQIPKELGGKREMIE